ncbi:MAG: SCP2 sterol-binding domain-containing protein [Gammaproteobacteria bacterium]|nr:SCP2 sterol-binding domain-containing protein [Gammaproteobacteria bacterium]
MSLAEAWCGALEIVEQGINRLLRLDPVTLTALAALHGKVIALEIEGLGITLYCLPGPHGITLLSHYPAAADTVLRGRPLALLRLARATDSSGLLFSGSVTIRGDIELGQRFKAILSRSALDLEEPLSRLSGDVLAHHIGVLLRNTQGWWRASRERLTRDAVEYLQEEQQAAPSRTEVNRFNHAVETLRDDVARLKARLALLHTRLIR